MIPLFPKFTKLEINHKNEIESIVAQFPPYSDFNFVSLFCWNINFYTEVSRIRNGLVIKLKNYTSDHIEYSLLASGDKLRAQLDAVLQEVGNLSLVPEYTLLSLENTDGLFIFEELENHDYIYRIQDLADLKGKDYKKKRNKVNQFQSDLGQSVEIQFYDSMPVGIDQEIDGLLIQWCFENDTLYKNHKDEVYAIKAALNNLKKLDLFLTCLRIDGKLKGISVNQILNDGNAICHFEKTVKAHNNIGAYLVQQVALYLKKRGCVYVNWEQDLGIAGLRSLKQSYHTYFFLKKFNVSVNSKQISTKV